MKADLSYRPATTAGAVNWADQVIEEMRESSPADAAFLMRFLLIKMTTFQADGLLNEDQADARLYRAEKALEDAKRVAA